MLIHFGILDEANSLILDTTTVFKGAVTLIVIILFVVISVQARFAVTKMLITAVMGGFVIWLVNFSGIQWFAEGIEGEVSGLAATTSVTQPW